VADLKRTEALPVKLTTNDQILFYGQIRSNELHGKRHQQTRVGNLSVCIFYERQARGTGAVYFANSVYFFGRLVLGDLEERNLTYKDGNLYQEGQFMNKKTNGKGSLVHLDSRKFENQLLE
jgi:hypothetical protein